MYHDNGNKTFLFLRRDVPVPILLNAIGHALIGFMAKFGGLLERIDPLQYLNANGGEHIVSRYPVIVLGVKNSGQIARLRRELAPLVADGTVIYNDFAREMIGASAEEQMAKTLATPQEALDYIGAVCFGPTDLLRDATKRFSLFTPSASAEGGSDARS